MSSNICLPLLIFVESLLGYKVMRKESITEEETKQEKVEKGKIEVPEGLQIKKKAGGTLLGEGEGQKFWKKMSQNPSVRLWTQGEKILQGPGDFVPSEPHNSKKSSKLLPSYQLCLLETS